jgi:hypothetical protein
MSKKRTKYTSGCLAGSSGCQHIDLEHLKNFDISIPPKDVFEFDISFGTIPFSVSLKLSTTSLGGIEISKFLRCSKSIC